MASENQLLQRLQLLKKNPDLIKPLTNEELADLLLIVFKYIKETNANIKAGVLKGDKGEPGDNGYTPKPGKDYLPLSTAQKQLDTALADIRKTVRERIDAIRDGEDAIITDEQIDEAAKRAYQMIQLPNFEALITAEPTAIRNALELLQGTERLSQSAVDGLEDTIKELRNGVISANAGGGTTKNWVIQYVSAQIAGLEALPDQTGNNGKFLTTDGTDASWATLAGGGDMAAATYDPASIAEQLVGLTATQTLTNKTLTSPAINTPALGADSVDAITEIAAALKSGSDTTLVTGTAGTSGDLSIWNADGDLVDGPTPPTGDIVGTSDSQTLTNKTIDVDNNTVSNIEVDNIKASALVLESETILSNDNDTTLPTSAAVRDFVDDTHADYTVYGFLNQSETTLAFNDSTYVFTLGDAGSGWSYYRNGIKYTISGDKTTTLAGSPPTAATYFIYIDATDGTLSNGTTPWTLADTKVPVAIVEWNNSNTPKYIIGEERHTAKFPRWVHRYLHLTQGTQFESGGVIAGYTVDGSTDAHNTFSITETKIWDEDIQSTCAELSDPDGATPAYHVAFRTAADTWSWELSEVPFRYTAAGYIQYDSSGTMTEGQASKYYNTYLLATNYAGAARFVIIHGQAEYSSLATAQAEKFSDLTLTGFPAAEAVALWQLTWSTSNSYSTKGKCRLETAPVKVVTSLTAATATPGLGTMASQNADAVAITGGSITGITDLAVADGGTGASDAAGAKTNLGFITDVVDDTTPQLGGDLDCNGKNLTDVQRVLIDATPDADHTATGNSTDTINAGATIAAYECVYLASDGEWAKADASATGTADKFLAIALEAGTDGNPMDVALPGSFIRDDTWAWTVGGAIYLSETAGALTQTAPTTTDAVVRVLGYAVSADVMYFMPETGVVHT